MCSPRTDQTLTLFLLYYAMFVCRSHDTAGSLAHGVFISRPTDKIQTQWQNPDPPVKSRPTSKIQTHWLGHKLVHIVIHNIKKSSIFYLYNYRYRIICGI